MKAAPATDADLDRLNLGELLDALIGRAQLQEFAAAMIAEDAPPPGDLTSQSIIPAGMNSEAFVVARSAGVAAGVEIVRRILPLLHGPKFDWSVHDGERVAPGQRLGAVRANLREILRLERPVLNLLGWLSGIATLTRQYVDAVAGARAAICDTRKTTPGLRGFEKYAVRCGGGTLHRLGLHDAVLYKDNHLAPIPAGQLTARLTVAIQSARRSGQPRFVEVEVDTVEQLRAVLGIEAGLVDFILLDNMPADLLRSAVALRDQLRPQIRLEASGGVNLQTVRAIAQTGVDRISIGAITHSAPWLDIGLDIAPEVDSRDQAPRP